MTDVLLQSYLTLPGMATARTLLVEKYEWFLHVTRKIHFESIKATGLELRNPGCEPGEIVTRTLGTVSRNVVCLRPIGTHDSTPRRGEECITLALNTASLPAMIGLDWSYQGVWTLPTILKNECPGLSDEEIFCEVVRRRGSLVSYLAIPPDLLVVRCHGHSSEGHSTWPSLPVSNIENLESFVC